MSELKTGIQEGSEKYQQFSIREQNYHCLMCEHHYLGLWVGMTWSLIKINVGHCDLYFMVQWVCLISWRLFDISIPYFGIMSKYDPMFDLKISVGHCDLYFIVHWFCLISLYLMDECHTFGKWVSVIRSSDLSFFNFCSEKHFSFIGKARFRRATLSCDSSYETCRYPGHWGQS